MGALMTTAHFSEDMICERGEALLRIRMMERTEDARLRKEMQRPVFREWIFWLGLFVGLATKVGEPQSNGPMMVGIILCVVALDRAARKRAQAVWDWEELQKNKEKIPQI